MAISLKKGSAVSELRSKTSQLCSVHPFKVPDSLRVGTLDTLMSLSDDLIKMDALAEGTVQKIYRQYIDLADGAEPDVGGIPIEEYTKSWEWEEAKFITKAPLREIAENISQRLSTDEDQLKTKVSELNNLKGSIQAADRKAQGNFMVRALTDIVKEDDILDTEYMSTVLVAVNKQMYKDWNSQYEKLAQFVVPGSSKLIQEDSEYGLFSVIVFKKCADEFKDQCRHKRFNVREFAYVPEKLEQEEEKKKRDTAEYARLKDLLIGWCSIHFAEAHTCMMHLKAIRIFVESVLRYGLTSKFGGMCPDFSAFILQPKRGKQDQLRKILCTMYGGSGASLMEEDEVAVPGASGGEFYPFVYCTIETAPQVV